jgi:hypothetical protein
MVICLSNFVYQFFVPLPVLSLDKDQYDILPTNESPTCVFFMIMAMLLVVSFLIYNFSRIVIKRADGKEVVLTSCLATLMASGCTY